MIVLFEKFVLGIEIECVKFEHLIIVNILRLKIQPSYKFVQAMSKSDPLLSQQNFPMFKITRPSKLRKAS
jgi:hypothetical protein